MRRTLYVIVRDRQGKRLGPAALRRLADEVRAGIPARMMSRYRGDYIAAGTALRPEVTGEPAPEPGGTYVSVALLKVRGDDMARDAALRLIAATHRIEAVRGHDGTLIGGRRS